MSHRSTTATHKRNGREPEHLSTLRRLLGPGLIVYHQYGKRRSKLAEQARPEGMRLACEVKMYEDGSRESADG